MQPDAAARDVTIEVGVEAAGSHRAAEPAPPRAAGRRAGRHRGEARSRFVRAGRHLLAETGLATAFPAVRAVCRVAGLPSGSFYHAFGDGDAFTAALVAELADEDADDARRHAELIAATTAAIDPARPDYEALVRIVAARPGIPAEASLADQPGPGFRMRALLTALAAADGHLERAAAQACAARDRRRLDLEADANAALLDRLGLKVREPFDVHSLTEVLAAVKDGFSLRQLVSDEPGIETLIEDAARAICYSLLVPAQEAATDVDTMCDQALRRAAGSEP